MKSKFVSKYSFLSDQHSKIHFIQQDEFFNSISKGYTEFLRPYSLNPDMQPTVLLKAFTREVQKKIIEEFTGSKIKNWRWELENKSVIDISKIIAEFFPEIEDRIISIKPIYPVTWEPGEYLFDEDSLRYELADKFLQGFPLHERVGMLSEHIQDISVFNLKTFRDIIQKWEQDKEIGKIILILQKLLSHYGNYKKDSKERNKMIQYLKITRLINNGTRRMVAYKIVSPGEKENTVEQRYLRQKYQLQKSGYEVDSPDHISVLMKDWDISEFELGF